MQAPKKINLGSGKDWQEEFLNVDILPRANPDWLVDICQPLPFGTKVPLKRFDDLELNRGIFDLIVANDVLEHLPDLVAAMTTCLDLLAVGGQMHVKVPYDLSHGAWQDPTHIRAFNERSWLYYTDWHWYIGWEEFRFDIKSLTFILSERGQRLQQGGVTGEDLVSTPRAVDAMQVVFEKIRIPPDARRGV